MAILWVYFNNIIILYYTHWFFDMTLESQFKFFFIPYSQGAHSKLLHVFDPPPFCPPSATSTHYRLKKSLSKTQDSL